MINWFKSEVSINVTKTRLTFYTENYLVGGAERYLIELMNRLDSEQYDLRLLCNENPVFQSFVRNNLHVPVAVYPIPIRCLAASAANAAARALSRSSEREHSLLSKLGAYPLGVIRYIDFAMNYARLARTFRSDPFDILYVNNGGYPGGHSCLAAILAAANAGIPVRLMAVHNIASNYKTPIFAVIERWIDRCIGRHAQQVITQSEAARASLIRRRGFLPEKIRTIYFGVDVESQSISDVVSAKKREIGVPRNVPVVGMIALFLQHKGYQVLLQAAPQILNSFPQTKFVLVGDGPFYESIRAQTDASGLGQHILFTGYRTDFLEILTTFDIIVLPSLEFESVPYVILDAMALGKPAIGSSIGGIPEAISDGETGLLVPPGDSDALARAVSAILADANLARRYGEAAVERVRRVFNMNVLMAETEKLFQTFLRI